MYEKWAETQYGIKKCMRYTYIKALKTIRETEQSSVHSSEHLNELGVLKLSTIAILPTKTRNQVIENAPLEKITILYNLTDTQNIEKSINNDNH